MLALDGLVCLNCRSGAWEQSADSLECACCGAFYPVLGGVPLMFGEFDLKPGERPGRDAARQILRAFELPDDVLAVERLRQVFATSARFGGTLIETESAQFLDRVRGSGHAIAWKAAERPAAAAASNGVPRYRWTTDYVPRRLPAGHEITANLRFENTGQAVLRRDGEGRVSLCALWEDADGNPAGTPEARTPLPIDVGPGRALTLPITVVVPKTPGRYRLKLTMVQEGVRWLDADAKTMLVHVRDIPPEAPPANWIVRGEGPADYEQDHRQGTELLRGWVAGLRLSRPRILEVGGNVFPMIGSFNGVLTNVDVDLLGLQLGCLVAAKLGQQVRHLCADAENLPIADGALDAIVIFASLHHFPDPAQLLLRLRDKLAPGGFIGVLCEPVGHIWPGAVEPAFLAELEKGVNEQSFSMPEYDRIFRRAGLRAAEVLVDNNSLKARLVRETAS